jgi:hypothetical protein
MKIEIIKGSDTPVTQFFLAPSSTELDDMQYQRDLAMKVIMRLERERDEWCKCAKLRDIAERMIEYVGHTSAHEKFRAELDQLKGGVK